MYEYSRYQAGNAIEVRGISVTAGFARPEDVTSVNPSREFGVWLQTVCTRPELKVPSVDSPCVETPRVGQRRREPVNVKIRAKGRLLLTYHGLVHVKSRLEGLPYALTSLVVLQ